VGEFDLLTRIRQRLAQPGPRVVLGSGDDAAISVPGGATATSVDALIDGVHFRREWSTLAQIGAKALAVALSDLAAMGAEAGEAYVVLGVPADLDEDGCLELLDGIARVAEGTGTTLAGGDVTRAPALTLAVTVVGHAERPEDLVTRTGARPGDALVLTGELGGAAAGLRLLEQPTRPPHPAQQSSASDFDHTRGGSISDALIARQLEPTPRLREGRALARAGATAMIDLSDGLGGDARHLAKASGVALRIEAAALPLAEGLVDVVARAEGVSAESGPRAAEHEALRLAVSGGEDYELLAAIPADRLDDLPDGLAINASPRSEGQGATGLTQIGEVVAGEGLEIRLPDGALLTATGFDQLG
jgi:thiamine-monophosphate kinase